MEIFPQFQIKEIETNDYLDTQNVVMLPPSNEPFASDEEGGDDIGLSGNINLPVDVRDIDSAQYKNSKTENVVEWLPSAS